MCYKSHIHLLHKFAVLKLKKYKHHIAVNVPTKHWFSPDINAGSILAYIFLVITNFQVQSKISVKLKHFKHLQSPYLSCKTEQSSTRRTKIPNFSSQKFPNKQSNMNLTKPGLSVSSRAKRRGDIMTEC